MTDEAPKPNIVTIYNRTGDVLTTIEAKDQRDAILKLVARGANLSDANLSDANLSDANLRGANLRGAYLRGAIGINVFRTTPLLMLLDQPGKIRAYKATTADGMSPIHPHGRIQYSIGSQHSIDNALTDVNEHCGAGINVATLDWVMREWKPGWRIFVVEFEAKDIAAIPTATDGKFRLHRCTVVGEKDLTELGLVEKVPSNG